MCCCLLARVYYPHGFVLKFTVTARFLFQNIWRLGLSRDEDLPVDLRRAFERWLDGLTMLKGTTVAQSFFNGPWEGSEMNCMHW